MSTQRIIEEHKRYMQKDTHPENEGARMEREVLSALERLAAFEAREGKVLELLEAARFTAAQHAAGNFFPDTVGAARLASAVRDFALTPEATAASADAGKCPACGGDGYHKGPRLGDEPCPACAGTGEAPPDGTTECPHGDWCCQSEPCVGPSDPALDGGDAPAEPSAADGGGVDEALAYVAAGPEFGEIALDELHLRTLAAEVRRLHELVRFREREITTLLEYQRTLEDDISRTRSERDEARERLETLLSTLRLAVSAYSR
jgi:hypothetical protein